jgi:hypothetical protein
MQTANDFMQTATALLQKRSELDSASRSLPPPYGAMPPIPISEDCQAKAMIAYHLLSAARLCRELGERMAEREKNQEVKP